MARRLTLLIHSLGAGGAERVLTGLANAWAGRGDAVTLLTFDDGSRPPFHPLDRRIRHLPLGIAGRSATPLHGLVNNRRRVQVLRRAFRENAPDAVVSFMVTSNVLALLAARPLGLPVVVSERSDPAAFDVGRWRAALRARLYPHATAVVVVTEAARRALPARLREDAVVIPNPVFPPPGDLEREPRSGDRRRLVGLGRLSREKGFDVLLDAFARVAEVNPGWTLTIWGEGEERGRLEAQRAQLGLEGRVKLPGATRDPYRALAAADLFVLPSRFEGFPNALCEALACGVPAIAFDCESGPREILTDGVNGLLVPAADPAALAATLERAMGDPALRDRLAAAGPAIVERFGLEAILDRWECCLPRRA